MLLDVAPYTDPLSRTPAVLRAVVEGRPPAWLDSRHAPDVVTPRETVAHLLLCEAEDSWTTRIQRVLEPGRAFPPGAYDGVGDADLAGARPLPELLDEFDALREKSLRELAALRLTPDDLRATLEDDAFGDQTVGQLLATWVAHDLYHLGQIFKSYSALYVDRIGPYQRYLNLPHFN